MSSHLTIHDEDDFEIIMAPGSSSPSRQSVDTVVNVSGPVDECIQTEEAHEVETPSSNASDKTTSMIIDQLSMALEKILDLQQDLARQREESYRREHEMRQELQLLRSELSSQRRSLDSLSSLQDSHAESQAKVNAMTREMAATSLQQTRTLERTLTSATAQQNLDRIILAREVGQLRVRTNCIESRQEETGKVLSDVKKTVDHVSGTVLRIQAEKIAILGMKMQDGDGTKRRVESLERVLGSLACRVSGIDKEIDQYLVLAGMGSRGITNCRIAGMTTGNRDL